MFGLLRQRILSYGTMTKTITKRIVLRLVLGIMFILCSVYVYQRGRHADMFILHQRYPAESFIRALYDRSDANNTIILALVDTGFVDMAINFYRSALHPFNITNFLFVSVSRKACEDMKRHNIPCFNYTEDVQGHSASEFMSADFIRKMNIRTDIILDALSTGRTVIVTDLDVVFLKNPLPELAMRSEDIVALWDEGTYNAGFVMVRPTKAAKALYALTRRYLTQDEMLDDQNALNAAISVCDTYFTGSCNVERLDPSRYMCGLYYFEHGERMFADQNPCDQCVVVHNNWIVSKAAKIYRFKEHHMWLENNDGYYSSDTARYITYSNSDTFDENTYTQQTEALRTALAIAHILKRILILPKFRCESFSKQCALLGWFCRHNISWCPMNSWYNVSAFDEHFLTKYRESSFLDHHLVPDKVKHSKTAAYQLTLGPAETDGSPVSHNDVHRVHIAVSRITPDKIRDWFSDITNSVLVLDKLDGLICDFGDDNRYTEFQNKMNLGIKPYNYRQLKA